MAGDEDNTEGRNDPLQQLFSGCGGRECDEADLARQSEWLGGEFYLATDDQVEEAWKSGHNAAFDVEKANPVHDNRNELAG